MNLTGEYRLAAARDVVWRALNDPDILRRSIPGCESVEKLSDTELTARVTLAIGPMKAKFSGKVTLSDLRPPQPGQPSGYTIAGEGQGGVAGFGKGKADVTLDEVDGGSATTLRYAAEAQVGGKIAQLGARLIDSTAKKLADQFFGNFAAIINAPAPASAASAGTELPAEVDVDPGTSAARMASSDTAAPPPVPPPADTTAPGIAASGAAASSSSSAAAAAVPASGGLRPIVWVPLVIAAVALLLWWFSGP